MKNVLATWIVCAALVGGVALADQIRIGGVAGVNITTFNNAQDAGGTGTGAKLAFQVRDGGCTYYRTGCAPRADGGITCVVDAGPGDVYVCFSPVSDPYQFDMPANADRVYFRAFDPAQSVTADVYLRRP